MSWGDYVEHLVATCGSLAAVAERLASMRGFDDDVGSIERALRRLRTRGQESGGTWGARALAVFGLPGAADERARWMGAYHSRFHDLPVPLCLDLVRLWDRPPVSEAPTTRLWLALAHATCSQRADREDDARMHLDRARASLASAPPEALGAPPFALFRRANGLAYARWKQGDASEAAAFAREAIRHAGDGGHVRARAMALRMLARIVGGDEGARAGARALAIVAALDDEALRLRFAAKA